MLEALRDDWLLALVRMAGVVVGVAGTLVTAPDAARAVWAAIRGTSRRWWLRFRALIGLPRSVTVHPVSGTITITAPAPTVSISGEVTAPWPDTVEGQTEWLRTRTDRLGERIKGLSRETREAVAGVNERVDALRDEHQQAVREIRERQDEQAARDLHLNSLGLPLIGVSIVLSGLPDPLARQPVIATLLLIATASVGLAVRKAARDARATAAQ